MNPYTATVSAVHVIKKVYKSTRVQLIRPERQR